MLISATTQQTYNALTSFVQALTYVILAWCIITKKLPFKPTYILKIVSKYDLEQGGKIGKNGV